MCGIKYIVNGYLSVGGYCSRMYCTVYLYVLYLEVMMSAWLRCSCASRVTGG